MFLNSITAKSKVVEKHFVSDIATRKNYLNQESYLLKKNQDLLKKICLTVKHATNVFMMQRDKKLMYC